MIATVVSIVKFFFGRSAGDDEQGLPRDLPADLRKRVKKLHHDNDIVGAAQLLYDARAFEGAALRFAASNMPERAADAYEQAGLLPHAIELYSSLGQSDRVAQLHARQGDHAAAAEQLLRLGQELPAADALARAGDFQRAAQIFTRHQQHTRAAKCFQDAGQSTQQMDALERQFKADLAAARGNLNAIQSSRHLARIAGEHFIQNNQVQRGVTLLLQANFIDEAATALHHAGHTLDAAKLFEKYDRLQDAADYYRLAQQPRLATLALARLSLSRGDHNQAARLFAEAQDYEQSAQLFLRLDQPAAAADMFLRIKAYDRAALAFTQAHQLEKAARCFEAANDHTRALDLYTQLNDRSGELRCAIALGNNLRAAKVYIALERLDDALSHAERVPSSHPDYAQALEIQGDILSHHKRFDPAARAYLTAYTLRRTDPAASSLLFKHARCLEMIEQPAAALSIYEQLLRQDPSFDKARARIERLRPRLQPAPATPQAHHPEPQQAGFGNPTLHVSGRPNIRSVFDAPAVPSPSSSASPPLNPRGPLQPASLGGHAASLQPSAQQASFIQPQRAASAILKQPIRRNPTPIHSHNFTPPEPVTNRETQEPKAIESAPTHQHSQAAPQRAQSQDQSFLRTPSALARNPEAFNASERPRYEVIEEIARGGMGVVYKARDTVLNRIVAYKILSESLKNNSQAVEYFIREARAAARLNHVSIVTVFDAGHQQGEYYMAMEYVNGRTLKDYVARQGPFPEKLVRFLLMHACRGLQYAHDSDIIHRDIKGGNMMLTNETKQLKIMDFGLAKVMTEVQRDANENTRAVGTPFYMSPEQIMGDELDCRSDIYSLGVTFFELATGTVPFFKGDVTYHHVHTPPPSPRALNPTISEHLESIILQAMAKRPQDRFLDCNDMLKALK